VQLPFPLPSVSDEQFKEFVTKVYPDDEDILLCTDIFSECLPRNPRKVKRLLQTFMFFKQLVAKEINQRMIIAPLLAKVVILQSQFKSLYEAISRYPTLLEELERYFRGNENLKTVDKMFVDLKDPILNEKIMEDIHYNELKKLLTIKVNSEDTFIGKNLSMYIYLLQPVSQSKFEPGVFIPESVSAAKGKYLRYMMSLTRYLNTRGVGSFASLNLNIEEGVVDRQFEKLEVNRQVTLQEIFNETARAIIIGAPGNGKTTILFYLAYMFSKYSLLSDEETIKKRFGIPYNLLPIFITLKDIEEYILRKKNICSSRRTAFRIYGQQLFLLE
jgi:predicted NACHT family NTPase